MTELDFAGLGSYVVITAIALFIGYCFKTFDRFDNKYIPVVVGVAGVALGILAFYMHVPWFLAADPLQAAAEGLKSGVSATWLHQLYKQLTQN